MSTLTFEPCHAVIGARVRGLDLRKPLTPELYEELHDAWMRYLVLVLPEQAITDEEHIVFARHFGDLEVHPSVAHRGSTNPEIYRVSNVDESGRIVPSDDTAWQYLSQSWLWHTDSSFRDVPSTGSILHGIEITNAGGNTLFANLYAAYDALDESTREQIDGLVVIHDHDYILSLSPALRAKQDKGVYERLPQVKHPLVRVHPVTGRKALFISPHTMVNIDDMAEAEGRALLDRLIEHATDERFYYRHVWSPHDIVMWDNRCTMHSVEPFDNVNIRRVMHRVTLAGTERPRAA